ncbi:myb family transcription factor PHL7-like isoform X2 [Asparagus officinalis]|nr:myb family transcription factor PHL7-like isoform X2 [Asparagus officinalis]
MGVPGLTIYHVKSHLQKYRLSKYLPDSTSDGSNVEKGEQEGQLSTIDNSSGMQITEALKLQMEVQKRLHEQLEVQRQLQLRIEAQGKYLKKIIEEQQKVNGDGNIPTPIPTNICHDSDKTYPSTPAPTSEEKPTRDDHGLYNGHLHNESVASQHEPLTPDSSGRDDSPFRSPQNEYPNKKQRSENFVLSHQILESSSSSGFQQPGLMFPVVGSHFDSPFGN